MMDLQASQQALTLKPGKQQPFLLEIYKTMHLMYIDMSLERGKDLSELKELMLRLAQYLKLDNYSAYYRGEECPKHLDQVPDIEQWILKLNY
jgi:hypothetical protein